MEVWITGGAGFIGSALAVELNKQNINDILIIDDLTNGEKFTNLKRFEFTNFLDIDDFINKLDLNLLIKPKCIFHQGAISDTMERDGKLMFKYNYTFSIKLFEWAKINKIPFIYASSAAVYGLNEICIENKSYENPINVYGYSKLAFDNYVRKELSNVESQVVGLRYFNVYGFGEQNKGNMSSTILQFYNQYIEKKTIKLFGEYLNYKQGSQSRDFIYIDDIIKTILWFYHNNHASGIYNLGTNKSSTFNDVAKEIIKNNALYSEDVFRKTVKYIDFPNHLKGRYQSYTLANMNLINKTGFKHKFLTLQEGIAEYIKKLKNNVD